MSSDGETVDISSGSDAENEARDDQQQTTELTRREIFGPVIQNVVTALGGVETDPNTNETRYVPGDDCLGCLKDLKKLWRKDDTDDERTVARMFWDEGVDQRSCPYLGRDCWEEGDGGAGDKRAVACADVIAAMTWPIDIAEELKELDEKLDERTDYATLVLAQLHYKEVLSRPESLEAMRNILMACMAKEVRALRDTQIILLVLHILRNLLVLKDPPRTSSSLSSSSTSLASLQSRLLVSLRKTGLLDFILMCASNVDNHAYSEFSAVLLEISYLLVRGVAVRDVVRTRAKKDKDLQRGGMVEDGEDEELKALLEREKREADDSKGRTDEAQSLRNHYCSQTDKQLYVLHRQEAISGDPSQMIDMTKQNEPKDSFMGSVLKDIRAERPRFTEKDNLRLLFLTKWFLEFFLSVREEQEKARKQQALFASAQGKCKVWPFGYVSQIVEPAWGPWVLRRMRAAVEEKVPLTWVELHAGIDCLVQIFERLQDQSIAYLDSAVHLAFVLLRMLEKWAQARCMSANGRKPRLKKPRAHQKFAQDIAHACLVYLARWREFTSSEQMRRIVSLLHRQAVKAKAEGFFFKVSTLMLFQSILKVQSSLPKDQPYKDLIQLINFVLRKFFKNAQEHPLLLVEAFYPKNRGQWKAYSSYEPEVKPKSGRPAGKAELTVKRGYKASEQIGIAVACLSEQEGGKLLIDWVLDILKRVGRKRQDVVEETDGDGGEDAPEDEDEEAAAVRDAAKAKRVPSKEAMDKFEDYREFTQHCTTMLNRNVGYTSVAHAFGWIHMRGRRYGASLFVSSQINTRPQTRSNLNGMSPLPSHRLNSKHPKTSSSNTLPTRSTYKARKTSLLATKRGTRRQRQAEPSSSEGSPGLSDSGEDDFLPNDPESVERRAARKAERAERRALNSGEESAPKPRRERKKKNGRVQVCGDHRGFGPRRRRCILCTGEAYGARQKAGEGSKPETSMMSHGTKKRMKRKGSGPGTKLR
ncbi:topoisomerase 1-associated factor 1 [Ceratobasidium sp. AG-Ba]|nr:topoisomerase 1-associated factor 1 [Ceratobasidium sp. AG-Ba]